MLVQFLKQYETTFGKLRAAFWDVTFDASYPAGGELLGPSQFPGRYYKAIAGVQLVGQDAEAAALLISWNQETQKLQVFYPTGGENASPAALADPNAGVDAGGVAVTSTAANGQIVTQTPGRGKEVLATTDLSTVKVRLLVFGY